MSPNPTYQLGKEMGVGTEGYAPWFLWPGWSAFVAIALSFFPSSGDTFYTITPETRLAWLLVLPFICVIVLIVFQQYVKRKYRTEFSNHEFEELINKAKARMGYSCEFEIWSYPEQKHILISNSGFLYSALVVSEPTVQDILAKPEEGEIILADAVRTLQSFRFISTWGAIGILIIITLVYSILALVSDLFRDWWPSIAWALFVFFPSPWVMRYAKERSNDVQKEYGIHPHAARLIIFRGTPPTDREVQKYIIREFGVFDNKSQYRKAIGLFFISAAISIVGGFLIFTLLLGVDIPLFPFMEEFRVVVSLLMSIIIFVISYFRLVSYFIPELE